MKKLLSFIKDKEFYGPLLTVGAPVALQNLIAALLNMIDTVMIGGLGKTEIAAVGLANQVYFLLHLFLFGTYSGAAIFIAQFWGERDTKNIRRVMGVGLATGLFVSLVFFLVAVTIPGPVLSIFSPDPNVIFQGSRYLRIVGFSYIMAAVSFCFAFVLRCTGRALLPVTISIFSLITNTALNYVLIYGRYGFPRLEVEGAAVATVTARLLEMMLITIIVYRRRLVPAAKIRELTDVTFAFIKKFFQTTVPVILNETLWAIGVTMFVLVYARLGTDVIAAINIFNTVERVSMVLFFGLSQACAVTVGHKIGAGKEREAFIFAGQYSVFGPLVGFLIGIGLIFSTDNILSVFQVSTEVTRISGEILKIYAFILPVKVFNLITIVGTLRGGGDTRFSLFVDTTGLWLISVPLAFLAGLVWNFPPRLVYLMVSADELFKTILGVYRLLSKKWLNNLTHSMRSTVGEFIPAAKEIS